MTTFFAALFALMCANVVWDDSECIFLLGRSIGRRPPLFFEMRDL